MTKQSAEDRLRQAEAAMQDGSVRKAHRLLQPLLDGRHPDALFLHAHFSIEGEESDAEFDERRIHTLRTLVQQGHARACFAMARHYEIGDLVETDREYAAVLDWKAAQAGLSEAKVVHGLNLYYGSYGMPQDRQAGLRLIEGATKDCVEGAEETLRELRQAACRILPLDDVIGCYKHHPEFLGLAINDVNQRGAMDSTLLHIACRTGNLEHVSTLIDAGADINARGDLGNTPLHDAALCRQTSIIALLLILGADATLTNEFIQLPQEIARLGGDARVCEVFSKFASPL